uniref:Uncharacterized protein n=1 Tax=Plectus sambesii TaxID=2011161 RepID=A0A914V8M9_9BILA
MQLKGCLFHHSQAMLRKVKRKGLLRFYNGAFGSKNVIWRWLRHICALPFCRLAADHPRPSFAYKVPPVAPGDPLPAANADGPAPGRRHTPTEGPALRLA